MNYSRVKYLLTSGNFIKKGKRKFFKKFLQRPFAVVMYSLSIKENRIVFDNFGGKGYGDSTKYIAEELIKAQDQIQQLEEDLRLKENELAELRQELAETEVRLERLEGHQE